MRTDPLRSPPDVTSWCSAGSPGRPRPGLSTASPVTFVALFPYVEEPDPETLMATAPVQMSDLLLALVYMGPDGQVYWAQRLQG